MLAECEEDTRSSLTRELVLPLDATQVSIPVIAKADWVVVTAQEISLRSYARPEVPLDGSKLRDIFTVARSFFLLGGTTLSVAILPDTDAIMMNKC